jgi:hypothetical protein
VAQLTILDLGLNAHAFLVVQPNVLFVNLVIRNGVSLDVSLAGAITVRLDVPLLGAAVLLKNVVFRDILGGALLLDCDGPSATPSTVPTTPTTPTAPTTPTTPTNPTNPTTPNTPKTPTTGNSGSSSGGIVVQAQLLGVVFVNIAVKPALTVFGNVQVQLSECQFENNGLASLNGSATTGSSGSSSSNNGNVVGASIYAAANVLGLKATVTLKGCVFLNNLGVSIINLGSQISGDELILLNVNTFIGNVATTAVINTNPDLCLVSCLGCNTIWTNNVTPLLCAVSCGLLGISLLCPGSCPGVLPGILGGIL